MAFLSIFRKIDIEKMKVGFFIPQLSGGGAERVVATIINQLTIYGHSIVLITSVRDDNEYPVPDKVVRYVLCDEVSSENLIIRRARMLISLRNIVKKEKLDILVGLLGLYYTILATLFTTTKSIISIRNAPNMLYPNTLSRFVAKVFLPLADGCVFQTEDAKSWFPSRFQNKSRIIFNPIGEPFYKVNYQPVKNLVVTCGRLIPQKNQTMLVKAFKQVARYIPDARLFIYGDGYLRNSLYDIIVEEGLQDVVFLKGISKNIPEILKEASLFVLSSDVEGAPNALMEAMAVGVPIVSTDCPCGGPRMLIPTNEYGTLVDVGDANSMANAIVDNLNNTTRLNEISENVKRRAKDFHVTNVTEMWVDYFNFIKENV